MTRKPPPDEATRLENGLRKKGLLNKDQNKANPPPRGSNDANTQKGTPGEGSQPQSGAHRTRRETRTIVKPATRTSSDPGCRTPTRPARIRPARRPRRTRAIVRTAPRSSGQKDPNQPQNQAGQQNRDNQAAQNNDQTQPRAIPTPVKQPKPQSNETGNEPSPTGNGSVSPGQKNGSQGSSGQQQPGSNASSQADQSGGIATQPGKPAAAWLGKVRRTPRPAPRTSRPGRTPRPRGRNQIHRQARHNKRPLGTRTREIPRIKTRRLRLLTVAPRRGTPPRARTHDPNRRLPSP